MKLFFFSFIILFGLTGSVTAQEKGADKENAYVQLSEPVEQTAEYRVFGSSFDSNLPTIALDKLIEKSGEFDNKTVTTEGVIKQVCQKKGCFFMLESDSGQARISFKDYSFFIPTNTAGSRVKLNGTFNMKTLTEEKAKHYAEDAGNDPETIAGPQKEYSLVATSVVIYK